MTSHQETTLFAAEMSEVSKVFQVGLEKITALSEVTFQFPVGSFTCIYGASGSGKTTLLRVLAGMTEPDSGEVRVDGRALSGMTSRDRAALRLHNIGFVFQANNLLPEFTAEENVALPLLARGARRDQARERALTALGRVDVLDVAQRQPHLMSGGQRQRVGIARALAGEQSLLLADEPTGALDTDNSRALFVLLRRLCDEHETSVVLATHDPLAQDFADCVETMVDGRLATGRVTVR